MSSGVIVIREEVANNSLRRVVNDENHFKLIKKCVDSLPKENYWKNIAKTVVFYYNSKYPDLINKNREKNAKSPVLWFILFIIIALSPIISFLFAFLLPPTTTDETAAAFNSLGITFYICCGIVGAIVVIGSAILFWRRHRIKKEYNNIIKFLVSQIPTYQIPNELLKQMISIKPEFQVICNKAGILTDSKGE